MPRRSQLSALRIAAMTTRKPSTSKTASTVAAEYVLGSLDTERVPWYAADWLAEGYDGTSLRELAGLDDTEPRRIADLLPAALAEMKVSMPTPGEAADEWFDRVATRLLDRQISEREASQVTSAFVSWNLHIDEIWRTPFTDLHIMVDEWDQPWGRSNAELAAEVRQLCTHHLLRRGRGS
jgi:hypothetical protein